MTKKANASLWPIGIPEVIEYDFIRSFVFIAVRCRRLASKRVADASGVCAACIFPALPLVGIETIRGDKLHGFDSLLSGPENRTVDVSLRRLLV